MKPRWVEEIKDRKSPVIAGTIIAKWWPGIYYLVSTVTMKDNQDSPAAQAVRKMREIFPEKEPNDEDAKDFVTQVFRCNKIGWVRDMSRPLLDLRADDEAGARRNHTMAVLSFSV